MKHNIIVAGVPRAGKSALSSMLAKRGYTHVSMDSIIAVTVMNGTEVTHAD